MSLKENFIRHLGNYLIWWIVGSDMEEKAKTRTDLDSYLEMPRAAFDQDASDSVKKNNSPDINARAADDTGNFADSAPEFPPKREAPSDNRYQQPPPP